MRQLLLVAMAGMLGLALASAARAQEGPTPAPGEIRGVIFHDRNGNGIQDDGEEGVQSRPITFKRDGTPAGTVFTDSNGAYLFYAGPAPADYTVTVDVDTHEGICGDSAASFNPFPGSYCVSAAMPWHSTTPPEVAVTASDAAGAVANFGMRPADVAVLEGLALQEDEYAGAGTLIEAVVNGMVCGSTFVPPLDGHFIGDRMFELHVLGAAEQPGCAMRGDVVSFRVGGTQAAESFQWVPFSDVTTFGQFQFIFLTAIKQHAWYWFTSNDATLAGKVMQAVIGGVVCGQASIESQGAVQVGFSKLLVPSAELQPGCGRQGATVTFVVDGVTSRGTIQWQPELNFIDPDFPPIKLPDGGGGLGRHEGAIWPAIAFLVMAGSSLFSAGGVLAMRRR